MRTVLPAVLGVAAVVALVVAVNPASFAHSVRDFRVAAIPFVIVLSMSYYVLQGVRWHFLLRAVGVPVQMGDTVLLNVAGQSTGLLPLGELTRAVLVSDATGAEIGAVVATVTVQELIYTLILLAAAVPGSLELHSATGGVLAALLGITVVFVILTVPPAFRAVLRVVRRTPLLRRHADDVVDLQRDTVVLLRRPDTLAWSVLGVVGALVAITLFWLVIHSIAPTAPSWREAAFIYAVSHIIGAISFLPGGIGAYEASTAGLLVAAGTSGGAAAAGALVHRAADKGLATVAGVIAYAVARRRHRVSAALVGRVQTPERAPS